jgi:plastocyanin
MSLASTRTAAPDRPRRLAPVPVATDRPAREPAPAGLVSAVRTPARLILLLLGLLLLGACSQGGESDAAPVTGVTQVVAKDNKFSPEAIEVPAGTTVTWKFEDGSVPHDVSGEGWKSGQPQRSGTFTHAFDQVGNYPYRCTIHSGMNGRVVVTGS